MREPAAKRRRLSPSDDESEQDSFASFSEDDVEIGEVTQPDHDSGEENVKDSGSGSEVDDDDDGEDGASVEKSMNPSKAKAETRPTPQRRPYGELSAAVALTGETYKSNIFKLQVDDLLQEVRPKYTPKDKAIERALRKLKSIIENIPERSPTWIMEAEGALRKRDNVAVPFPEPRPPKDAQYKLQYAKPAYINAVGSFPLSLGTKSGSEIVIDLVITMPSNIFQEKDYLNYRYFYKRAYYLACLAAGIKDNREDKYKLSFDHLHGNQLLPILIVEINQETHPSHDLPCRTFKVVILPSVSEDLFSRDKLLPNRNCVRPKDNEESASAQKTLAPTPFYNASIRVDGLVSSFLKLQYQATKKCDAYKDACVLGRIWLRQRGFTARIRGGGFGNFEWSALIALLLHGGGPNGMPAFSSGYSSYQLFKAALQYVATRDLAKTPQIFGGKKPELPKVEGMPVLFDAERGLNILFKMTPWSYKLLQYEARTTVAMLSDSNFDHFNETFILRGDRQHLRYDVVVALPLVSLVDEGPGFTSDLIKEKCLAMYNNLAEGLSDRVKLINLIMPEDETWPIGSRAAGTRKGAVLLGCILDPANAHRLIDHGPTAEDKIAAAKFRKFWGQKAELRRFRDGSILETVIWPAKDETGFSVFRRVLSYIIEKHVSASALKGMIYNGDADAALLPHAAGSKSASTSPFQPMMEAFRQFEQDLRALDDIPLQIRHLLASDSYLSYSSVDVPLLPHRTMTRPAEVILQFEGSARWPDDLDAIQRTKMAFFLKIAELLERSSEAIRARVGIENEDAPLLNQSFLDVHYIGDPSSKMFGAAFRIRIHHDRELTLLERRLKDKTLSNLERQDVASAIAAYKRVFIKEPAHTQALQTLATRYPAFSGTARLLTKWIGSHRLSNHISPYLTTLFAAKAFTNPHPWAAASSPQTGLYRTLLFLSKWDWRSEPWIVDLGSEMHSQEVDSIRTRFDAWRKIDPAMNRVILFAGSNVDGEGNTWTDNARPAKVVAGRLVSLAKAAIDLLNEEGVNLVPEALFESSLGDYDILIHLDNTVVNVHRKGVKAKSAYKNLDLQNGHDGDLDMAATASIGFDPAKLFLEDLERVFGQALVFFYDDNGGDVIPGLWNPSCEERSWKLSLGYSSVPVRSSSADTFSAKLNKEGIVSEIAMLGGGMVKRIDIQHK
ncbi:uncharacterized protein PV09_07647 [Verruconis gallopava]|uniref:U3 small nucleolar RNA-associated protein 22 n=1 Tax=Verruconis gallopava TaxID=253628 RepID=A0A0D2A3B9_9PEZI|nr:uncharacterized protein PV09_07647 [Verruconis gallopava]KIW00895.1 hypothetical protein PV09_07647 [Verruconis gallopava]